METPDVMRVLNLSGACHIPVEPFGVAPLRCPLSSLRVQRYILFLD